MPGTFLGMNCYKPTELSNINTDNNYTGFASGNMATRERDSVRFWWRVLFFPFTPKILAILIKRGHLKQVCVCVCVCVYMRLWAG